MLYNVKISGMGCMHCVARVKAALEALGAKDAKVEINSAEFSFDGGADAVRSAIEALNFKVVSIDAK